MTTKVGKIIKSRADGWLEKLSDWYVNFPGKPYSIQIDSEMKYHGEPVLRFEMRKGDSWIGPKGSRTFRDELVPAGFPPIGSDRFYACSIFVPQEFPMENNRLVLLQWWPQTKTELGEVGRSPSLALRYVDGTLSVTIQHSDLHVVKDANRVPEEKT